MDVSVDATGPESVIMASRASVSASLINVALLGVVSTALAYVMYFHLINRIKGKAITVAYLVPVFGVLWGSLLLGEVLTTNQTIGALLVLIGVSLATGFKLKSKTQQTIIASERK